MSQTIQRETDFAFRWKKFFDYFAIAFLFLHVVFLLLNWNNYPTELDTPYHLLMGRMFGDSGKVLLWDSYEFAPVGRPHLYPPLLHIIIWLLHSLINASYMNVGRIIVASQAITGLFLIWFISRKFFNSAVALFSLIFFASSIESWWWLTSVGPIAVITVLFLPFIFLYYKKRVGLCILILTLCLYLNYGLSFTLIMSIFMATVFISKYRQEYLKNFLIILGVSITLFAPWLLHIYNYRYYIFNRADNPKVLFLLSLDIKYPEILLNLNIALWIFIIPGIIYCCKRMREDFKYSLFFMSFISYFLYIFLFQGVRFNAHSMVVASVIAGLGLYVVFSKAGHIKNELFKKAAIIYPSILIFSSIFVGLHWLTSNLLLKNKIHINFMGLNAVEVFFRPAPLLREINSVFSSTPLKGKHLVRVQGFFTSKTTSRLLVYLEDNIDKNEVIHIDNEALADYITLQTGIKTDTGMYWEIATPEMVRKMEEGRSSGYYVSPSEDFQEVLPRRYRKDARQPKIIQTIGEYYIGHI